MIRTRFKKLLLVAPAVFPGQLLTGYKDVKHITAISNIFPSLYLSKPDAIIFDYDYIGQDIEKIVRRIKVNKFYNRLKICCYKNARNEKTDSLLKALGVDYLFFNEGLTQQGNAKTILDNFNDLLGLSVLKQVASVSY